MSIDEIFSRRVKPLPGRAALLRSTPSAEGNVEFYQIKKLLEKERHFIPNPIRDAIRKPFNA